MKYSKTFFIALLLAFSPTQVIAAENIESAISEREQEINSWLTSQEDNMLNLLERITNINSGTLNKAGVDEMSAIFNDELSLLGFSISTLPGDLIAILDTVFPLDSPFQTFHRNGDVMYGPGVADMHGGLVVMLYALKALNEFGELDDKHITILLNSDEEIGSLSSRNYIEEQAQAHDWGLVYESSGTNNLTRVRKGLGQARFVVNGIASHAGGAHEQGRSAIKELAYKIVEIENMTDYETGVTVNVGIVNGGEARNTVSPCAEALIDLRYPEMEQGVAAQQKFEEIANSVYSYPIDSGEITTDRWINLHRPPKIPTVESDYLLEKARAIGRLLGQELGVTDSGGGTDGSLTQAAGLPTLDSLGVAGTGAHSNREEARVSSLVERAQLSAVLIRRLAAE
jgi:glutamate carboxypeptidase